MSIIYSIIIVHCHFNLRGGLLAISLKNSQTQRLFSCYDRRWSHVSPSTIVNDETKIAFMILTQYYFGTCYVTTSTSQMKNFILLLTYFRHQFELQMSFTQIVTHCLLLCMFSTKVGMQQTNTNHLVPFFIFYYILYRSKYDVFGFCFFFFWIQCLIIFNF